MNDGRPDWPHWRRGARSRDDRPRWQWLHSTLGCFAEACCGELLFWIGLLLVMLIAYLRHR